jgi:PIN domain nuclease of toxin-antitoxin system
MRFLIDTHVLIWWQADDSRLGKRARAVLADPQHEVLISIASLWEMSIKFRKGKLSVAGSAALLDPVSDQIGVLHIDVDHLEALEALPQKPGHNDPFDQLILAQAKAEEIPLLTGDRMMTGYGVSCIGVG